jgi:predicted pyridoxine 5'-phosphate oxidase superfamily flavin-nucleotide-binding protein
MPELEIGAPQAAPPASPFHDGEREAQARAGVRLAGAPIRDHMPEQHRSFFALLRYVVLATTDAAGWPVATMLTGAPGFVSSPDPRTLRVAMAPDAGDPVRPRLAVGAPVGVLGIDLATRRRNRANGRVAAAAPDGIAIAVEQSFGNCPQYIQARDLVDAGAADRGAPGATKVLDGLDAEARALVAGADTFFVASASGPRPGRTGGMDVSHRGGRPGFVKIDGDTLVVPDFRGNRYFNTLGNFLLEPRAALLFVDFASGDLLQLQAEVTVSWDLAREAAPAGAERLWRARVAGGWRRRRALPLGWSFREMAPTTARTGAWPSR